MIHGADFPLGTEAPFRILLIEDNPGDARLIAYELDRVPDMTFKLRTADCLALFGLDVTRDGTLVSSLGFTIRVEGQCSALYETALLGAAILASPFPVWRRLVGILVGASAILAVNVVRIASLVVIGALAPRWFTSAHLFVWQAILVALIASFWLVWIDRAREATAS